MSAIPVRHPRWVLTIAGADVTAELMPFVLDVTYTDHLKDSADEVTVKLEDRDGLFRGPWYPTKGDALSLSIGYAGEGLMPCGRFELDEIGLEGPPDIATIKAVSAAVGKALRTTESRKYEKTTLKGIADQVAGRHGLSVVGEIDDIHLDRVTQSDEHDLAFLKRLSDDYGHIFSVRGDQLVFQKLTALRMAAPVTTIRRTDVARWRATDKLAEVYAAAEVSYHEPGKKKLIKHREESQGPGRGDTLKIKTRAESPAQAQAKAKAALAEKNRKERTVSLELEGDPRLVAGVVVQLAEFGAIDGPYLVERSTHKVSRKGGYTMGLELTMGGSGG